MSLLSRLPFFGSRKNAGETAPPQGGPYPDDADQPSPARAAIGQRVSAKLARNPMIERLGDARLDLFLRPHFATPAECAALRAMIDAGAQPSILFSGTQGPEYRTSHSCHMDRADPLVSTITERICALMGVEPRFTETLQGQRYTPGQEYKPHWDYFPLNDTYWPDMREMGGQRTWTAMLYCSDVEAGGETQFVSSTLSVTPAEGALLLWNNMGKDGAPNTDSAHYARPVEAGVKYVLTLWFRERPWL